MDRCYGLHSTSDDAAVGGGGGEVGGELQPILRELAELILQRVEIVGAEHPGHVAHHAAMDPPEHLLGAPVVFAAQAAEALNAGER